MKARAKLDNGPAIDTRAEPNSSNFSRAGLKGTGLAAKIGTPKTRIVIIGSTTVVNRSMWSSGLKLMRPASDAVFVFNLIPIPPLDGSRVLYAFAPDPVRNLFDQIEPYGIFVVFALVLMGGLGGFVSELNQAVLNLLP